MDRDRRVGISLLSLRVGVFIVMLAWTLDKFVNPGHADRVFETFYGLELSPTTLGALAGAELLLLLAFVAGWQKRITYGLVLVFHAVSTVSAYERYLDPWENLLFFAAWPMLAACLTLYLLRDSDTILTVR